MAGKLGPISSVNAEEAGLGVSCRPFPVFSNEIRDLL